MKMHLGEKELDRVYGVKKLRTTQQMHACYSQFDSVCRGVNYFSILHNYA